MFAMGPAFFEQAAAAPPSGVAPNTVAGFTYWLSASDLASLFQNTAGSTPVTASGQSVARANDAGGGATLNFQTNGTAPVYDTADGFPALTFDGTSQSLKSVSGASGYGAATLFVGNQTACTIIGAAKFGTVNGYGNWNGTDTIYPYYAPSLVGESDGGIFGIRWVHGSDGNDYAFGSMTLSGGSTDGLTTPAVGASASTWHIYSLRVQSGVMQIRIDGGAWESVTLTAASSDTGYDMNMGMDATSHHGQMSVTDFATFNAAVSDADIAGVETYFANLCGVTL